MINLENNVAARVISHFEQLTKIPRCSGQERKVSDYLKQFGEHLGLETIQDEVLNIIIKKPASPGYEDHTPVILQGHMDMVCEKDDLCSIDFTKDPIKTKVENGFIVGDGTTLGADNGIAVAMAMAILEDKDAVHPPIEALFTVDEERTMLGAREVDLSLLDGKILLNLDTEEEGVAVVGCSGGVRMQLEFPYNREMNSEFSSGLTIAVTGLTGGHSGMEIHLGRANANVLLTRLLLEIEKELPFGLISFNGGAMDNAIPRLAKAEIACHGKDIKRIEELAKEMEELWKFEHGTTDPGLTVAIKPSPVREFIEDTVRTNLLKAMLIMPNGVQAMNQQLPVVESSINMGVVITEPDKVVIKCSLRSANATLQDLTENRLRIIAELFNANAIKSGAYPAWPYKPYTKIQEIIKDSYRSLTGKELKIEVIHAGLECAMFAQNAPDVELISFGPDITGAHAPGEAMNIASVENVWKLLLEVLKNI
ncbi:MAG: aminoacyl-histidine dipeptidase [Tissierellia bacterium]|nr:aminoacyl-histidine dipeptidase [Tissierellia bacterium]